LDVDAPAAGSTGRVAMDAVYLAVIVAFFGASLALVALVERLRGDA
jgi:hypothetical protein